MDIQVISTDRRPLIKKDERTDQEDSTEKYLHHGSINCLIFVAVSGWASIRHFHVAP